MHQHSVKLIAFQTCFSGYFFLQISSTEKMTVISYYMMAGLCLILLGLFVAFACRNISNKSQFMQTRLAPFSAIMTYWRQLVWPVLIGFVLSFLVLLHVIYLVERYQNHRDVVYQWHQSTDNIFIEGCINSQITKVGHRKISINQVALYKSVDDFIAQKSIKNAGSSGLKLSIKSHSFPPSYTVNLYLANKREEKEVDDIHHHCGLWQGRIKNITGVVNDRGFDYQKWAMVNEVIASFSSKDSVLTWPLNQNRLMKRVADLRFEINDFIQEVIEKSFSQSFLLALLLGDRSELSSDNRQLFQFMGISHIVAISGLHLGLAYGWVVFVLLFVIKSLTGFVYFISYLLLRFLAIDISAFMQPLYRFFSHHLVFQLLALLLVLFYALLTGWQVPAQRTWFMAVFVYLSLLSKTKLSLIDVASIALIFMVIFNPILVLNVSFQLSMMAIFIIIIFLGGQHISHVRQNDYIYDSTSYFSFKILINKSFAWFSNGAIKYFSLQAWFYCLMLPISLYVFGGMSLLSYLYNAITIVSVAMFIFPLGMLSCLLYLFGFNYLSQLLMSAVEAATDAWWHCLTLIFSYSQYLFDKKWFYGISDWHALHGLSYFSKYGISLFSYIPYAYAALFVLFIIILLILNVKRMLYVCLLFAIILLTWLPSNRPSYGEYEVDVLDVSQGLSVLIKTNNHALLYDFGASSLSGFNYYQSVILPQLLQQRLPHLPAIVISHNDNDHVGGFPYFQSDESRAIAPRSQTIFMPRLNLSDNLQKMSFHDGQIKKACEGQSWIWDGVTFEFVNTHSPWLSRTQNNRSCVLKVTSDSGSILIPGDIEWPIELLLSKRYSAWLKSDVLIAPHHGSTTSSSEIFVDSVRPSYVIYSSAMFNRYGHPHDKVRRRYQRHSSIEYNTACDGKVSIQFKAEEIKITSAKKQSAKVWHQPCPGAFNIE